MKFIHLLLSNLIGQNVQAMVQEPGKFKCAYFVWSQHRKCVKIKTTKISSGEHAKICTSDSFPLYGICYKYKKQLQKIERKVGMEYQKAYKQG